MPDYGKQHKRLRAYLLARYIPGVTLCARCSLPITTLRSRDIHLGHDDHNPLAWRGLEHARCNTSAGGGPAAGHASGDGAQTLRMVVLRADGADHPDTPGDVT